MCKAPDDYCGNVYGNGVLDHDYLAHRGSVFGNSAYQQQPNGDIQYGGTNQQYQQTQGGQQMQPGQQSQPQPQQYMQSTPTLAPLEETPAYSSVQTLPPAPNSSRRWR